MLSRSSSERRANSMGRRYRALLHRDWLVLRVPHGHYHHGNVEDETFRLDTLGACLQPDRLIESQEGHVTRDAYGPIMVLCCCAKGYLEPLYLVFRFGVS